MCVSSTEEEGLSTHGPRAQGGPLPSDSPNFTLNNINFAAYFFYFMCTDLPCHHLL